MVWVNKTKIKWFGKEKCIQDALENNFLFFSDNRGDNLLAVKALGTVVVLGTSSASTYPVHEVQTFAVLRMGWSMHAGSLSFDTYRTSLKEV
jgi:3-dehydroquinate synthase class II